MYERFIDQLKMYSKTIRILSKGYLPITLLPPSKLNVILQQVKEALYRLPTEIMIWLLKGYTFIMI